MGGITKHYLISGRVQGVGFRAYTQRAAKALKLFGWVRNLGDGRVEALAYGSPAGQSEFEKRLRQGPPPSLVTDVKVADGLVGELGAADFEIRKDGTLPCCND